MPHDDKATATRFWARVSKGGPDECWPWTGAQTAHGHGVVTITVDGKPTTTTSARLVWEELNGAIPEGHFVVLACGRQTCCNPAHMSTLPYASACRAKQRHHKPRVYTRKLSDADVAAIKQLRDQGKPPSFLAAKYKVSETMIYLIVAGKRYKAKG